MAKTTEKSYRMRSHVESLTEAQEVFWFFKQQVDRLHFIHCNVFSRGFMSTITTMT